MPFSDPHLLCWWSLFSQQLLRSWQPSQKKGAFDECLTSHRQDIQIAQQVPARQGTWCQDLAKTRPDLLHHCQCHMCRRSKIRESKYVKMSHKLGYTDERLKGWQDHLLYCRKQRQNAFIVSRPKRELGFHPLKLTNYLAFYSLLIRSTSNAGMDRAILWTILLKLKMEHLSKRLWISLQLVTCQTSLW